MKLKKLLIKKARLKNASQLTKKIRLLSLKQKSFYVDYFSVYMHKKLNYYLFKFLNKFYNYSNGQLLHTKVKEVKHYKKSKKSFSYTINILNKKLNKKLNSINVFYLKNYNLKNYNWLKKFFITVYPTINYMICSNSWNYIRLKHKRIKKKIYKNIIKKSKSA